ncbi:MucR family transcriptional regulator [Methylobacterium nodulans]|uniref:Transcriptional regulator, MucR family n=1 Tax=Methylobacterium nodulans (strain LMG 21967 / CNCM I-2342 / ORS 2060) TaxID=460265 RepID=B8IT88_METNO|nr:MucR family transcriptional regulator [Methylobacterium nodulans]ACL56974.1 transcriptional regulator, MucR family [Methylobacterium nodulans ORS 2060]
MSRPAKSKTRRRDSLMVAASYSAQRSDLAKQSGLAAGKPSPDPASGWF